MSLATIRKTLRAAAIAYPGAKEEFPWGERCIKVKGKIFAFLGREEGDLSVTTKLPETAAIALTLPFTEPTGYGLGKSGWVTATFARVRDIPVEMLLAWIDESYRAVAPKKLIVELDAVAVKAAKTPPAKARTAKRSAKPKAAPARRSKTRG